MADSASSKILPKIPVEHPAADNGRRAVPALRCATSGWRGRGRCRARRGWSTASAAWKSRTSPATSATTRTTTSTWSSCGPRRWRTSPTDIPLQEVDGPQAGDLLVLSWGGTYGACATAVAAVPGARGCRSPMPTCATSIRSRRTWARSLANYDKVLVPELNMGQLQLLVRGEVPGRRRWA